MKKYCSTCKFCSDVVNNAVVSCDSDCRWKERPSYTKYMIQLEKDNASINPVTGGRNDSCPARSIYGYSYHDGVVVSTPAQYVKCAVRNKRFDCRYYVKTDKVPYIKDILCPHCDKKMDICTDRWHGSYWGNDNVYMKPDDCDFICSVDDGKIVGFDVYKPDHDSWDHGKEYYQRSRRLGAVVVEVKTRLGISIDRSDYGWTDSGDYYKKKYKPSKPAAKKKKSFWSWLITDDMVVVV